MRKKCIIVLSAFLFLSSPLCATELGTFFVGAKYWYTSWDSGALEWYGDQLAQNFSAWGIPISVDTKTGDGYLAGPLLGYQTPNGKWNISFAPMILTEFYQEQDITVLDSLPGYQNTMGTDIDLERHDYDLAVSYALTDLQRFWPIFQYCKVFAGLKYQKTEFDLTAMRFTNGILQDQALHSSMDYTVLMPTVGFGIAYPYSRKIVLSAQAGIGQAYIDENETVYNGYEYELDLADSMAYNAELGVNFLPMDKMIVQLGYRYQQWTFDPQNDEGTYPSNACKDVTHGPSLSLVYTF